MEPASTQTLDESIETPVAFLTTVFAADDIVLFRPIETWTENGKKRSQVDYANTGYRRADPAILRTSIRELLRSSEKNLTNLFFGVCPRFGRQGEYDLAWQIRTVRCVWADIDHVSVDDALERVGNADIPKPSIVVNSGNGVHFYWLLDEPYLIDDVGPPTPVKTEWVELPGGRRKPRKYTIEDGERIYLDKQRYASRLSNKAQHLQNIVAGIGKACGGDHTTDLSRLLRIPGSFNRKDQRNGREPVAAELTECDPGRRYPISLFESLCIASSDDERMRTIASLPLPKARKPSAAKSDRLNELVATCSLAPPGLRSEADFGLCCFSISKGIGKEHVWSLVEDVGKFAEQGRRYFDVTWDKAEFECRVNMSEKVATKMPDQSRSADAPSHQEFFNPNSAERGEHGPLGETPTIQIDAANIPVSVTLREISQHLLRSNCCFLRCEQLVAIKKDSISTVLSPPELAGLLSQFVEFYFVKDDGGEYKPLPATYGGTWLNNHLERHQLPEIKLFTRNPVFTEDWRLVASGFDAGSGIYSSGELVEARAGTEYLDRLLRDFCFKSPADRTNYIGVLLTGILVPRFIGAKPAALFNGNQPGLGKSVLAQLIAIIRDGHATETASFNANDEEFEKRLGSIVRRGSTTIIIDNAKGQGRKPRIESACLERSITDPVLSFRLLGKSLEIRAENSHIFCVTANAPDVSLDLVSRSIVINLEHEGDPKRRTFRVNDPEGYALAHRRELLGELINMVQVWIAAGKPLADVSTRFNKRDWGKIVGGILHVNDEPDFLTNAEETAVALDGTRSEFNELVGILGDHPQGTWSPSELVDLCQGRGLLSADLGTGTPRSLSTKLGTIAGRYINERFRTDDGRIFQFLREKHRSGNSYRVALLESAEP
ncbi:hypothetical protein [Schlesneria sp.]|uniref:hypothetical protein n=1 Tax=Schlesneria sp. TaxID=2762018 RepID=UPI002EF4CA3B